MTTSRRRRQLGATSVEFALVGVASFMLIVGIFEVGRLLYGMTALGTAAREAARYGIASANTPNGPTSACYTASAGLQTAATASIQGVAPLTVTATEVDVSGKPDHCTVTVTWPYKPATGLFNIFHPHLFTSTATLYFYNNLQ